jgi:hypothetical protein
VTEPNANYWHLQGLIGGDTRWKRHIEQSEALGVRWDKLPKRFKQRWWKATEWEQHQPSPEDLARLPELLTVDQAELENDKREIAADTARALEYVARRHRPPAVLARWLRRQYRHVGEFVIRQWWRWRGKVASPSD